MQQCKLTHAAALVTILAYIGAGWTYYYWHWIGSAAPTATSGDAIYMMARAKVHSTGEVALFTPNIVDALNAPFQAHWSDFPASETIFYTLGRLVSVLGFAGGTTFALFLLQAAAGIAFYGAGTALRYRPLFVSGGAILFALAPYAFYRGLGHVTLTVYWHIPLMLLALVWLCEPERTSLSRRGGWTVSLFAAFVTGALVAYYCYAFVWFAAIIGASALVHRHYARFGAAAALIAASAAGFVLQHLDTFITMARFGRNAAAIDRNLPGVLLYALRLPDMLFPKVHHWTHFAEVAKFRYFARLTPDLQGETFSTYIGIVSIAGLTWLLVGGTLAIPARRLEAISLWYWVAVGTIAIAITGGITFILAAAGVELFRGGNRFTIVLTAVAILFLCEQASRLSVSKWSFGLVAAIVAFAMWDQIPPRQNAATVAAVAAAFETDRAVAHELEARLDDRAMIFQLPVVDFPERPPVHRMQDYEHLRLFLHTTTLRYSYGQAKGRPDALWQHEVEALPLADMVATLERYGFAALLINRRAYEDGAAAHAGALAAHGLPILVDRGDFVVFRLSPAAEPELPPH